MLETLTNMMDHVTEALSAHGPLLLKIVALLWGINLLNAATGYRLNILGILPRHPWGIIGIPFAPFLHGGFNHLFMNTILFLFLGSFMIMNSVNLFFEVSILIILISGILTWLFGRKALHVGSSSLIMGYWGYLLVHAYQDPSLLAIVLGGVCFYYFAEMAVNLMPNEPGVSWEGHCFGVIAGVIVNFIHTPFLVWFAHSGILHHKYLA